MKRKSPFAYRFQLAVLLTMLALQPVWSAFELLTSEVVRQSLKENGPAWSAKIAAQGRPLLLLNKAGLEQLKARAAASPRSPEMKALLETATELASKGPRVYVSPEEQNKKGESIFSANGEGWVREVGDAATLLVIAAAIDPSPARQKAAHDAVIALCNYPSWGRGGPPGTAALREDNMDLACAHAARAVAIGWDWLPHIWSAADRALILKTIDSRANQLLGGLYGKGFWARGYSDNHNQVNCNALGWCGLAFYTDLPQAPEWLAAARLNFQNVAKYCLEDGSSAEGVPYWSYGMSYILQYIEGTRLIIDSASLYQEPFLKNTVAYRLNASTSGLGGTLPWGDAVSRDFDGPHHILRRLAVEYQDPSAAWLAQNLPWAPSGPPDVLAWMVLSEPEAGAMPLLPLDYHDWSSDLAMTRSGWGAGDYLLAIKSGFTNRNHSHLDAGALALAFDVDWLLTTPGYGLGKNSAEFWDFGNRRWSFFSNSTESHCTLLVNGKNQRHDLTARSTIESFLSAPQWSWCDINLTEAYKDVSAARRAILHRRGDYILVFDTVAAPSAVTVEWLAQVGAEPETKSNALVVKGESSQVRVEMVSPALAFSARRPTSEQVDIPAANIRTYAAKSSGERVEFLALLQPGFSSDILPEIKTRLVEKKTDSVWLSVQGAGWTDSIFRSATPAATEIKLDGAATGQSVKAKAQLLAVRVEASGLASCVAAQATELQLPGLELKTTSPVTVGLQRLPNGSWIVDATQDVAGQIVHTSGKFTVQPLVTGPRSFRSVLVKEGTTLKQATEWLATQVLFRSKAPVVVRALSPQPALPSSVAVAIEAENFERQKQGAAEVITGKPGARGKSLRGFGNSSTSHQIAWSFEVPQSGQYQLTIRYATKLPEASVAVLIDGAAVLPELVKIALPSTGGWSVQEDNWKDLVLSDAAGKPLVFHLTAGKHELRLAKPAAPLALDQFEFRGVGK